MNWWGKARPGEDQTVRWHPLAWHLLDVAASARALLQARPQLCQRGAELLQCSEEQVQHIAVSAALLHDVGKFCASFQWKASEHVPEALRAVPWLDSAKGHPQDGFTLWHQCLRERLGSQLASGASHHVDLLVQAACGHHGRPVGYPDIVPLTQFGGHTAVAAATDCLKALFSVAARSNDIPRIADSARIGSASWWLAGVITLSDWIGSNTRWFAYQPPTLSVQEYWIYACAQAKRAILETGLQASESHPLRPFTELTGLTDHPTPLQQWVQSVALPNAPTLVVMEDVTGAGKTEAALLLVHRLIAAHRASGVFWALPTQATANAMYLRQAKTLRRLFSAAGPAPSLVLAHGQARLDSAFRGSTWTGLAERDQRWREFCDDDGPSAALCAAYLADSRRLALMADVGAGTVDQAVLGALPSRFNVLRLAGLCEKVLVIDEAHAYDAYVGEEVIALLRFQAAMGGHAIVLSATLTDRQRREMIAAWQDSVPRPPQVWGVAHDARSMAPSVYPLATIAAANVRVAAEHPVAAASSSCYTLGVRQLHDVSEVYGLVLAAARRGAAVAWVRNTVDSCVAAARELRALGLEVDVIHGRFAYGDRQARERTLLERFGRHANAKERRGRVVVATQVIEQSLDLDFDVMVSDLAPIDLLLQRAGRLWRHARPLSDRADATRTLHVLAPPALEPVAASWVSSVLPRTEYVYSRVDVLWRTAEWLGARETIRIPQQVREAVEYVYGESVVPPALQVGADKARGVELSNAGFANYLVLRPADGYVGGAAGWSQDTDVSTRLTDGRVIVRIGRVVGQGCPIEPWHGGENNTDVAWALSEVRVRLMKGMTEPLFGAWAAEVQTTRLGWSTFEQSIPLLPLLADGTAGQTVLRFNQLAPTTIRVSYNLDDGLVLSEE